MTFLQAIKSCTRKYATFSGRAPRSEYWWWFLFTIVVSCIARALDIFMLGTNPDDFNAIYLLDTLSALALVLPGTAVAVRRLHDVGRSGWWILIAFTIVGVIPLLFWFCKKGTLDENRFGPSQLVS